MTYGLNGYGEAELEWEGFGDLEDEAFGDPFGPDGLEARDSLGALDRIDAETAAMMMDLFADMAAEAESEEEADAFLPIIAKLAPMALKALAPMAKKALVKFAPRIANGVLGAGRKMLQNFGQKGMAALPDIARGVARDSVQAVADGRDLTGQMVMQSAAQHTLPFLQDPRQTQQAAQQCRRRLAMAQRQRRQHRPQPYYGPQPYGPQGYGPQPYGPPQYGAPDYGPQPYGPQPYGMQDYMPEPSPDGPQQMPQPHYQQWFS
jgi:hypothetical protein